MTLKTSHRLAIGAMTLALAGGGATYAYAAGTASGASTAAGVSRDLGPPGTCGARPAFESAAADYLGLTPAQLRTQHEAGKSLAQIAAAQGKSVAGLEDAIYAAAKADLDKAVANGRITSAQEQTILVDLKAHIDDIVNHTGPPPLRP